MKETSIVIVGTPKKNKTALIIMVISVLLLITSFFVASYAFNNNYGYDRYYGGFYQMCLIYDNFGDFFSAEFFNSNCFYGYMIIFSVIAFIVGLIIKLRTENSKITVTMDSISGKSPQCGEVMIPLNQVTALDPCAFNGISVTSIGNISKFYCFENREEVIKAIAFLLANSQQGGVQRSAVASSAYGYEDEAERLKSIKELLDSGIITQEEYDTKKREVLGL